jgi:zinc/manganese transport system substrate-binding protein
MRGTTSLTGLALSLLVVLTGCGARSQTTGAHATLHVVAAENVWGSIVAEIGGDRVTVSSVLSDPNADPHEYESKVAVSEEFATAAYVVVNGAGYDTWAQRLLDADPSSSRRVLDVAVLLGKRPGDNPHFWYGPAYVERVADRMRDDLIALDPSGRAYYEGRRRAFEAALRPYRAELAAIRHDFHGRPVGATENIVVYLARAVDLRLISPPAFMQAVANGTEPPVSSVAEFERQIAARRIAVLLYNAQTVGAVTTNAQRQARRAGIPIVTVTETVVPPKARFEDWQTNQLRSLYAALAR